MLNKILFRKVDNSALIVFRIFFGLLIFLESVGAIFTGWVKQAMIDPKFTFTFIGFEWLQPLPYFGMYVYYAIMGLFGLFVMLGLWYRISIASFTLMWTLSYLMQKTSYNNHYYLLILICLFMLIVPANAYASVDAKRNPAIKKIAMPNWVNLFIILQLLIVYTFASAAKLYPDWLDHTVSQNLLKSRWHLPIIGPLLKADWLPKLITYGGIFFDGLIIPALLWKPTRRLAFIAAIVFHLFNSAVLHIGIFPYLSLAFCLFFFSPKSINKQFLKEKPFYDKSEISLPKYKRAFIAAFTIYFAIQIALPLRHWIIPGNVLFTEEGHRMAWRMMLRGKIGKITFYIEDESGKRTPVKLSNYLTKKQEFRITTKPDMIWQFAQRLKKDYAEKGQRIKVFASSKLSVNGKPYFKFIDPSVDLAAQKWNHFKRHKWVLSPENGY